MYPLHQGTGGMFRYLTEGNNPWRTICDSDTPTSPCQRLRRPVTRTVPSSIPNLSSLVTPSTESAHTLCSFRILIHESNSGHSECNLKCSSLSDRLVITFLFWRGGCLARRLIYNRGSFSCNNGGTVKRNRRNTIFSLIMRNSSSPRLILFTETLSCELIWAFAVLLKFDVQILRILWWSWSSVQRSRQYIDVNLLWVLPFQVLNIGYTLKYHRIHTNFEKIIIPLTKNPDASNVAK